MLEKIQELDQIKRTILLRKGVSKEEKRLQKPYQLVKKLWSKLVLKT